MKAVAYLRVSTEDQAESQLGLEAQRASCILCAARLGIEVSEFHSDAAVSSVLPLDEREGLLAAVGSLGKGDVLVVAKRDRVGRDTIVVGLIEREVERRGARIISAAGEGTEGDGPADQLMRKVIDAVAEYERLIIKLRTKSALAVKKVRGEVVGKTPYGWNVGENGKTLAANEDEQDLMLFMLSEHAKGVSFQKIADQLNERRVPKKYTGKVLSTGRTIGSTWTKKDVFMVLKRKQERMTA